MEVIFGNCDKFNNEYNVIVLERMLGRKTTIEFYLEKVGYGNLLFMVGRDSSSSDFGCLNPIIKESIEFAKNTGFWQ